MILSLSSSSVSSSVPPVAFTGLVIDTIPSTGTDIIVIVFAFTFDSTPAIIALAITVPVPFSFRTHASSVANSIDSTSSVAGVANTVPVAIIVPGSPVISIVTLAKFGAFLANLAIFAR